ncbi:MAG TPA: TIGR02530 family flagellar biosynthesis protein [Clostridiales bacterium]|nr:TIGR02530 family flagellar biosynthesis protein [Clostridiales bacterium]
MGDMWIKQNYIPNISSTPLSNQQTAHKDVSTQNTQSAFGELLQQKIQASETSLVFSKHAAQRLQDRDIEMSAEQMSTLSEAVGKAEEKGIKNALILGSENSFIVNIPSKTVVTIMSHQSMKENVVTNIDGTVII